MQFLTASSFQGSVIVDLMSFMIWTKRKELLQIIEISRNGCNLWLGQGVRNRFHDGRCVWIFRILTPLRAPVHQFVQDVVLKLTCQTRKRAVTFALWTVTGSAWRNIGTGKSLFVDFFPPGYELPWSTPQGFRIEILKMRGKSRSHRRAQDMRHAIHIFIITPALNKCP